MRKLNTLRKPSPYQELIKTFASMRHIPSKKVAKNNVNSVFEIIADEVFGIIGNKRPMCDRFRIPRFGVFYMRTAKAKRFKNPMTGKWTNVPETEVLAFRASKYLRRKSPCQ